MQQPADQANYQNNQNHLAIGYQLDQYEIESIVDIGDFRITYYAWDNRNDRNVIIHEYFPKSLAVRRQDDHSVTSENEDRFTDFEFGLSEFLLEARLVSQIHSAYLPHVVEYREANGTGYLISEYDDGASLRQVLDEASGKLSDAQVAELLKTGLQGLRELHARNLLHTSVSPTNLFIRNHGHPLLLGQGLARYRLAQYTKTYTVSLAQGYTPLEQYGLDGNIGPWSDLYALGASLYECIAGVRPVDASTRHTALIKGEDDPLTPAVELGKGEYSHLLLSNIDWMLKPYIEDRPDSADLMLGIVNFQKQKGSIKTTNLDSAGNTDEEKTKENIIPLAKLAEKSTASTGVSDLQESSAYQVNADRSSKFVYWSLGLALLVFLTVTGYQIYQHELKQNNLMAQTQEVQTSIETIDTSENENTSSASAETVIEEPTLDSSIQQNETENQEISKDSDEQRREFYENLAKEEEVERRVEEEIKALEAQQQAEQEARERAEKQALQGQISDLLNKAAIAKGNSSLLKPEGESAYDYYSQVLELQPENDFAHSGLNDIADHYFSFALKALEEKDPDKANLHLTDLIKVKSNDPRLAGFLQQITDLKAELKLEEEKQRLEQEKQRLLEEIAQAEENKPEVPKTESPAKPIENAQQTETKKIDETEEQKISSVEVVSENEQNENQQSEPVAESKPEPPSLNRVQLAAAYNAYDSGRYSDSLFNTILDAANNHEGRAQYILAEMYAAGRGTEQNFAESTYWLKRSLDHVNQNARYRQAWAEKAMGVIYEKGWYVDSDTARAVRWYRSSADKDYSPAQYRLGLAYAKGLGVKKDIEQAEFWFKKALSNGHQEAKKALSKLPTRN